MKKKKAEAFFKSLEKETFSGRDLFARILQDLEAFEHAVTIHKLHELIPELNILEEGLPVKDPNIYRPLPVMRHMLEAIRQTFGWMKSFGAEEYASSDAKQHALLWVNTALLFHDQGEIALVKGTNLPLWYHVTVDWTKKRKKNILRETYPFFGIDTTEGRSYLNHLRHPEISALLASAPLTRLGWDSREVLIVQFLIRNHSVLIEQATYGRLKDGRTLHEDLYRDIISVYEKTGVAREDLLKMLQVVQIMDAKAIKPGMAQIPQETMMRVWMAYSYMNVVLAARSQPRRHKAFRNYRKMFSRIRKDMPFGTPFVTSFKKLLRQIEAGEDSLPEEDRKLLEEELEYFERFEVIREDHIHINNQCNQLLHLIERKTGKPLSEKDISILLQAYKIAYRSHDGQFRRAHKIIPTGDKRRKYIEHPIEVAKIMVESFEVTDPLILAAVLLHDVLEDTDIHVDDIPAAFRNEDVKGRIINAIRILTKPATRKRLKRNLHKDLAYLAYVSKVLTAGDIVLDDRELFEWLRFVLPLTKAADKIHNRRSLMARKPEGRIKEICRNGNTLLMFMEASNLAPEKQLAILDEFDKSFFEIFNLMDLHQAGNEEKFRESLAVFKQSVSEQLLGTATAPAENLVFLNRFVQDLSLLSAPPQEPGVIVEKLRNIEKKLPILCRRAGLSSRQTSKILDAFAYFLFSVSEVRWITDDGKRKLIQFQAVVRHYRKKIDTGEWKPKFAGIIETLARYAQGWENAAPPSVRFGILPDIFEVLSKVPALRRRHKRFLERRKRKLVARLLPRIAMLPVKKIYWLKDNHLKSIDRAGVEGEIGGVSVSEFSGRIVLKIHNPLALLSRF